MTQFNNFMETLSGWGESFKIFVYGGFAFLNMNSDVVNILFWLMLFDTALGVVKSITLGKKFSFKKLVWGMVTKVSVLLMPMILALIAKGLSFDFNWFVISVVNVLVVSEGFSAITNILSIRQKKDIKSVDFVTVLIQKVRDGLQKIIERLLGNIEGGENPQEDNNE